MPPVRRATEKNQGPQQTPAQINAAIEEFLREHAEAVVLEDGKVLFDLRAAQFSMNTEHGRCTLHLWSEECNLVRTVLAAVPRDTTLRLSTQRFGQAQPKLLELVSSPERRTPTTRDAARTRYMRVLERVLTREFPDWKPEGFRTAMDLERSFGPAYTRGTLVRGNRAWAVIGVGEHESAVTVDGILTLGILWLHHCRESAGGKRLFQGLRLVLPRGSATLTLSRLGWLNQDAAQWELHELDEKTEELVQRDAADTGNLRTRLVHHPDEAAARERFAGAVGEIMMLVPAGEQERVEQRLRSTTEMAFLLHGLEFARARVSLASNSFAHAVAVTIGVGPQETLLDERTREDVRALVANLFKRRRAFTAQPDFAKRGQVPARRIGAQTAAAAHSRLQSRATTGADEASHTQDPLYRAAPERWLESMLRQDLAPLTRGLAGEARRGEPRGKDRQATHEGGDHEGGDYAGDVHARDVHAGDEDDARGNRAEAPNKSERQEVQTSQVIPRLDPRHVYTQVPAIAGASDRGLLDLLGVTSDGRLAVIELKADDDLHFALQGLDYWVRVRHHHLQTPDAATGLGEFAKHGYFHDVELSPLPPRLYLAAPALHIHPATETVLRYLSPRVEWHLLALDERWRQGVRVVWRKSNHTTVS